MNENFHKLVIILSGVFYTSAIMLIFLFYFINTHYFPLESVFDLGINPVYLWIIMFLVSFAMIPYFIIIKKNFQLSGEELYQEKIPQLYSFSAMVSVVPVMCALFNFIFTQNLLISIILLVYGALFGIVAFLSVKNLQVRNNVNWPLN
ncbi:MAG: hypothetical protein PWQ15_531 [Methanobacterium sp.]|uniref:hypothetical protein n=1 Tax=Methanobacterium sp. TaxID=2164 RepID=UPI0024AA5FEA|nr:hypothetical protein [Methanobacterium sp.]MDI3549429.1 hypothetical protein [Methanobacterium sp.]